MRNRGSLNLTKLKKKSKKLLKDYRAKKK